MPARFEEAQRFPLAAAFGLYTIAFLALAWPWLSGAVEIPYDAASQFYPQLAFLGASVRHRQSPFLTPNVFAGWPQIADPQSLIFSPAFHRGPPGPPNPSRCGLPIVLVFALLYAGGAGVILFFAIANGMYVGGAPVAAPAAFRSAARLRVASSTSGRSKAWCSPRAFAVDAGAGARALILARRAGAGVFAALIVLSGATRCRCSRSICWRAL